MIKTRTRKPKWIKEIARERIDILLSLAEKNVKTEPQLCRRYVALARKISKRYLVRIPAEYKHKLCKFCGIYLIPSFNQIVRLKRGYIEKKCKECGGTMKIPYIREKLLRRKINTMKPTVLIGKNGFTEEILSEIKNQLETKNLIKIKFLPGVIDRDSRLDIIKKIQSETGAIVKDIRGNTFMLEGEQ